MLRVLLFIWTILYGPPAFAAMECDTTSEETIISTIHDNPTKLVKILSGSDLAIFLSNMTNQGYLVGSLPGIDRIYIVDAGKKPGYTVDQVWLFFVEDGCLVYSTGAIKSIVMGLLP